MGGQQRPVDDHEVGQTEQAEQLRFVLGQTLVADFLVTERVLDHVERCSTLTRMLALNCSACSSSRAHLRLGPNYLRLPGCIATCQFGPCASSRFCTPQ